MKLLIFLLLLIHNVSVFGSDSIEFKIGPAVLNVKKFALDSNEARPNFLCAYFLMENSWKMLGPFYGTNNDVLTPIGGTITGPSKADGYSLCASPAVMDSDNKLYTISSNYYVTGPYDIQPYNCQINTNSSFHTIQYQKNIATEGLMTDISSKGASPKVTKMRLINYFPTSQELKLWPQDPDGAFKWSGKKCLDFVPGSEPLSGR